MCFRVNRIGKALTLSYLLLALGCGGDKTGPTRIEVEGSWTGHFQFSSGASGTLTMVLTEANGTVTGNGTTVGPGGSISQTISGTYVPPNVLLSLHTEGFEDTNISAVVGETQMTGTMTGSGFNGTSITLTRQ
jgi:hypothetical protein